MTWQQNNIQISYSQGGPLSFIEENQMKWAKIAPSREVLEERSRIQAEMEIMRRRAAAAEQERGGVKRVIDKRVDRLLSLKEGFLRERLRLEDVTPMYREKACEVCMTYANYVLTEADQILEIIDRWEGSKDWVLASEKVLEDIDRKRDFVGEIRDQIEGEMERLANFILRKPEPKPEPEPEPKTADQAMEEMRRLSDALDEAKKKAKDAVDYEKATGKMAAFGSAGLGLFSLLLVFSSASGFLPGLALIISVFGTVFFALAFVGASGKAKKIEEQWQSPIKIWEDDLAKATSEWLKLEGIYDYSNPEIP